MFQPRYRHCRACKSAWFRTLGDCIGCLRTVKVPSMRVFEARAWIHLLLLSLGRVDRLLLLLLLLLGLRRVPLLLLLLRLWGIQWLAIAGARGWSPLLAVGVGGRSILQTQFIACPELLVP